MVDPWKRPFEILAVILAMLFVLSTPVTFTLYSLERNIFDAQLYIQAMDEQNVYGQLPALIAQTLSSVTQTPGRSDLLSIFRNLTPDEWQRLLGQLLPAPILRTLTEDAITQIMGYLNGERPEAVLSLAGLKAHLQSPEGINAVNEMLDTQPDCTVEQITAMALNQQALTICDPPDSILVFDLRPIIAAQINWLISLVPAQVTLIPAGLARPAYLNYLKDLRVLMHLSPLFPILCLAIIAVLVVRTWRDWLNWWGYPLLFAGLISLFLTAISAPLSSLTFQLIFAPALPAVIPAGVLELFKGLTGAIVRHALQPALLVAGSMILAGLVMVALGFLAGGIRRVPRYYV